jgi:hypothetical protein
MLLKNMEKTWVVKLGPALMILSQRARFGAKLPEVIPGKISWFGFGNNAPEIPSGHPEWPMIELRK